MSNFQRVIPRDLFNDANLLKCLGVLYLQLEKKGLEGHLIHVNDDESFNIELDPMTGDTYCTNVYLESSKGERFTLTRPLNSREPFPLQLQSDSYCEDVFLGTGELRGDFSYLLTGDRNE